MSRSLPPDRDPADAPAGDAQRAALERRAALAAAGYAGEEGTVRAALGDEEPAVRAAALAALVRHGWATPADAERAVSDPAAAVRVAACELAPRLASAPYRTLLSDPAPEVVEAAAFACGEISDAAAVPDLCAVARQHEDPLCREAAVAALGAIGDPGGKAAILAALADLPAIRRRAVIALAAFSGPDVEAALRARLEDRDWQVRQAAEELLD